MKILTQLNSSLKLGAASLIFVSSLLHGTAKAQNQPIPPVNVSSQTEVGLPLVSIGDRVGWKIGTEDYRVNVAQTGLVRLEVFSPELNRNDYANLLERNKNTYLGDELYGKNATLSTNFSIANLINRSFKESTQHSFVELFNRYALQFSTSK